MNTILLVEDNPHIMKINHTALMMEGYHILEALDAVAAKHGAKQAEVALAWIIARQGVTAPIASATSLQQLESLIKAASLTLDKADMAELDKASA